MPYGYHPATHFPWGSPRISRKPAPPRQTWDINQRGHITGEITDADYCRLIDAGRHGDKAAIAELQRRDALGIQ